MVEIAPIRGRPGVENPWQGSCAKKPWQYEVTVCLPHLDHPDQVELALRLWRAQTWAPYFLIVDTGSRDEHLDRVRSWRAQDLEVFEIRSNGWEHPSDPVAVAMDLAFSRAPTPWILATHTDVFPRTRDLVEMMVKVARGGYEVVGYEMSPRAGNPWEGLPSHTLTLYSTSAMDRIRASWSLRRWHNLHGKKVDRVGTVGQGWPDTEVLLGESIRDNNVPWFRLGSETNGQRHKDQWIDHCRSMTCSALYSPESYQQCMAWYAEARKEAEARATHWEQSPLFLARYRPFVEGLRT